MANAEQLVAQPEMDGRLHHQGRLAGAGPFPRSPGGAPRTAVNAISPASSIGSAPKEELEAAAKRIPAGYVGSVEDAASAVRFLLSDEARYVNARISTSGAWESITADDLPTRLRQSVSAGATSDGPPDGRKSLTKRSDFTKNPSRFIRPRTLIGLGRAYSFQGRARRRHRPVRDGY